EEGSEEDPRRSHLPRPLPHVHPRLAPHHSRINEEIFPTKLHRILSSADYGSVVAWKPHGRAWHVADRKRFAAEVLPRHFDHPNLQSFN
ncbi:hypothetical protein ACHAWF_002436, partial [Thalassiosira exigua]